MVFTNCSREKQKQLSSVDFCFFSKFTISQRKKRLIRRLYRIWIDKDLNLGSISPVKVHKF